MHERYLVAGAGYWGGGETLAKAKQEFRKAGGRLSYGYVIHHFTSDKPFAPWDRDATDGEADAYIDRAGWLNWENCDRQQAKEVAATRRRAL